MVDVHAVQMCWTGRHFIVSDLGGFPRSGDAGAMLSQDRWGHFCTEGAMSPPASDAPALILSLQFTMLLELFFLQAPRGGAVLREAITSAKVAGVPAPYACKE